MNEKVKAEIESTCVEAENFCDQVYNSQFASTFSQVNELHSRMKSTRKPITDEELTYIITEFPLDLFAVSEALNNLRLRVEVMKLENSKREIEKRNSVSGKLQSEVTGKSQTVLGQIIKDETASYMTEYKILEACYNSVITRVENQLTFSRELIMGAKKIWDSRRSAEASNPINPVGTIDLLPYQQ